MKPVRFLTFAEIELIHQDQLRRYGGRPSLRDPGLLSAAVSMPETTFEGEYLHRGPFQQAAAYLFHLCQNHPFIDGNKRVALASALVFLDLNGLEIHDPGETLYDLVIRTASGNCGKDEIAAALEGLADPL